MPTILHLSDLHRDSGTLLTTNSLLESLRKDCDRYTAEGLSAPDIAIVSGDIAYGVPSDSVDSDYALEKQYREARDFLSKLAVAFFQGDHERIVIVPGNHDVSHPHVLRATTPVATPSSLQERALFVARLLSNGSTLRWDWKELSAREITSLDAYQSRLAPFSKFYSEFYNGAREFPLDPARQFSIHDFPTLQVTVAGLSSCHENDLFNRAGRIHPDCIAGATRQISSLAADGRVPIAVWHHNLSGGPRDVDYLDADFLQSLMDGGFAIGMHGHQHRPQFLEHRFTADEKRSMKIISAGTLCGGPRSLPTGRMRGYNLVTLDRGSRSGTLHVRNMVNTGFDLPVWGSAYVSEFGGSKIKFEISLPRDGNAEMTAASRALAFLREGDANSAYLVAREHPEDGLVRRVAIQALTELDDPKEIIRFCTPPRSSEEIVILLDALYQDGKQEDLRNLLSSPTISQNSEQAILQSVERARARLRR
jgi:predicted MPP superfamily phosphohydrolase